MATRARQGEIAAGQAGDGGRNRCVEGGAGDPLLSRVQRNAQQHDDERGAEDVDEQTEAAHLGMSVAKTLVSKKSAISSEIVVATTALVVARPTPWVPPEVVSP